MKKWIDYIDNKGLIVGLNFHYKPEDRVQTGDTLQRCGMWFLFSYFFLRHNSAKAREYIQENFKVMNGWEKRDSVDFWNAICFRFYKMYYTCYFNEKTQKQERYPIRHPFYELKGSGKTSRDQMMSNLWALLVIATSDSKVTERSKWAQLELYSLWKKLKRDFFILPANDVLAFEHLSVFWRFFYFKGDAFERFIYKPLIWLGDFHNYLSSVWKNVEAKKTRHHTDDVNRICMVLGANFYKPTFFSKLSLKTYALKRPAYIPKGEHYHGKPNEEYDIDPNGFGPLYAIKYYSYWQEAPWDDFFLQFSDQLKQKVLKNEDL